MLGQEGHSVNLDELTLPSLSELTFSWERRLTNKQLKCEEVLAIQGVCAGVTGGPGSPIAHPLHDVTD